MRVPEDEHIARVAREEQRWSRPPQLVAVADVQHEPRDRHGALAGERRVFRIVHVAGDGRDRRNLPQRLENPRSPDVTSVHDQIDAGKHRRDLRPHQAVRIRDQSHHIY